MEILGLDIRIYFLLFMIYSVIGWCMEVTCKLIQYKRFINRGFLIGPYCPIYGYGAILITILLKKYIYDPWVLFVMAILVCGTLEYLTSFFMENIFKARWWYYSQRKFNLNGRVCLGTIIPFGILGLFIMYVSNPFLLDKLELIPEVWLNWISGILFSIYIVDNIVSTFVIRYVKKAELIAGKDLDNTEEMTTKVKEILENKSVLHRRLVKAYPTLIAIKSKIDKKTKEIKQNIVEQKDEITRKVENTAHKVTKTAKSAKEKIVPRNKEEKTKESEK